MFAKYKSHDNSLYNKLVELSRNIFFYENLLLKDNFITRINLIFIHFSIILILFNSRNKDKFPQKIFDNIFLNIEYHLREIGHGDVVVNKKMKSLTRIFYDILIKMDKDNLKSFNMNENILKKYLEPEFSNDNEFIAKLSAYFENFYNFCFVLGDNIVLKGQINFKYK